MSQIPTKVKEIMITDVVTIEPSKTANEAAEKISKTHQSGRGIGSLVVIDKGKVVGILTEYDLVDKLLARGLNPGKTKVEELMSKPIISCTPETSIRDAAALMAKNKISHLIVIEDAKLAGIIATFDIILNAWWIPLV